MKTRITIAITVATLGVLCGTVSGAPAASTNVVEFNNPVCPVMADATDGTNYVVHNGIRYGMCCAACAEKFKKDPGAYLATLPNKGKIVDLNNMMCPVTGVKASAQNNVVYNGTNVLFFCPACYTVKKDSGAYIKTALKSSPLGRTAKASLSRNDTAKTTETLVTASRDEMP